MKHSKNNGLKSAAIVIWYNPEKSFVRNIKTYADHFKNIIVIDNSDTDNSALLRSLQNAVYIPLFGNKGISAALNSGIVATREMNVDWVLTMDQDSAFEGSHLQVLMDTAAQQQDDATVAIVGWGENRHSEGDAPVTEVRSMITSGCLNRISAIDAIGGFNEALFIDCVDFELCYRLRQAGYRILQDRRVRMIHAQGNQKTRHFWGKDYITYNYSPTRYYYQVRNNLYLGRVDISYRRLARRKIRYMIRNVLLFETNKIWKLFAIFQGAVHFLFNRYGARYRT